MRQLIAPEPPYSAFLSVPGVKGTSLEDAKARNEKLTEELKAVIEA